MKTGGVILAAGMSKRMGKFKPLLNLEDKTMIEHSVDVMLASGISEIVVVLGYRGKEIQEVLWKQRARRNYLTFAFNSEYETTQMLDSVKAGLRKLQGADAFYLLPGDMPAIDRSTYLALRKCMEKTGAKAVFPTWQGYRKHPPLIARELQDEIIQFQGKDGLRGFWGQIESGIETVSVNDQGCIMDADTKEEFVQISQYISDRNLKKTKNNLHKEKIFANLC